MKTNTKDLEELTIPKGTVIHLRGIPFELPEDTKVLGLQSNLDLANNQDNAVFNQSLPFLLIPCQAASLDIPVASLTTSSLSFESIQDDK